jgi:hypothetical protein
MEEHLRNLERLAAQGDTVAAAEWTRRMVQLGRIDQVPVGYLPYLHTASTRYRQEVLDLISRNVALQQAALTYWIHLAGGEAFRLHHLWAGDAPGGLGPRNPSNEELVREFATWARVWVGLLFLQSVSGGDDPSVAAEDHEAGLLAGSPITHGTLEDLSHVPLNNEIRPLVIALYG